MRRRILQIRLSFLPTLSGARMPCYCPECSTHLLTLTPWIATLILSRSSLKPHSRCFLISFPQSPCLLACTLWHSICLEPYWCVLQFNIQSGRPLAYQCISSKDRDGAIQDALAPWALVRGCRKTAAQLTKLYVECEALVNYHCSAMPISLARVVHSALTEVSERLDLRISPLSAIFNDTMARILAPSLFPDVEPAVTALADRGVRLVCLPPHSFTTMAHYKSALPRAFLDRVSFSPTAAPVHTAAPREMFRSMCDQRASPSGHGVGPPAQSESEPDGGVLVVSTGVGRILAPAIRAKYATALLKRPESVEANVDFCVGLRPGDNPEPLLVVHGLMELCAALKLL